MIAGCYPKSVTAFTPDRPSNAEPLPHSSPLLAQSIEKTKKLVGMVRSTGMRNPTFVGAVSCVGAYCQTRQGHQNLFFVSNLIFSILHIR
jgi:hypothetical protein